MAAENIFQHYLQPVRSVQDYTNDMDRSEQNALTLAASRQSAADDAASRAAYQQGGGDTNKIRQLLQSAGQYKALQAFDKNQIEIDDKRSSIRKNTMGADKDAYDLEQKKRISQASSMAALRTPDDAIAHIAKQAQDGVVTPEQAQAAVQAIPRDPMQFTQWQMGHLREFLTPQQQIELNTPKYAYESDGQSKVPVQTNANAPGFVAPAPIKMQATPGEVLSNGTSIENNKRTVGASLTNAAATREVAGATRYAANAQRDQATEMKLADDYRAQSKDFGAATSAYKQINATLDSATTSPAATLAAATKFMKILDPGSVVRESELGMALQASGVLDRAANYMNILQRGKVLTPTQVADFRDISQKMYSAAQQVQQTIDADYKGKAKAYNLRPEMVTQELGQNVQPGGAPTQDAIAAEIARRAAAKKSPSAGMR